MDQDIERDNNLSPKIKDSINLGLTSGLVGTLTMDIFNLLNWRRNRSESLYGHMAGSVLMKGFRTKKVDNFIFGEIIHIITGVLAGIPLVFLFKKSGKDSHLIKGAAYGSFIWMVYYVFGIKLGMFNTQPKLNRTHFSSLWQNVLYGVVTAKSIVSLAHPAVFNNRAAMTELHSKKYSNLDPWVLSQYSDYETERPIH